MKNRKRRTNEIKVRFTDQEYNDLKQKVMDSGLSRETYIRTIISGIIPVGKPSEEYLDVIHQLKKIGSNINQLAIVANKSNSIDTLLFKDEVRKLTKEIAEIKMIASQPIMIGGIENRNNKNMGS